MASINAMKPAPFSYYAPKTVAEAVATLSEVAPLDGRVLAGGQSLVPTMAFRLAKPLHLVDINGVKGLDSIRIDKGQLIIRACVRHAAFHRPVCNGPLGCLLTEVVGHIAHYPIRNRGTFCGSLAHADPASEWCLVFTTFDGEIKAQSTRGLRTIAVTDFFTGVMSTALKEDELLIEAYLPLPPDDTHCGFYEFSRRAGDFAIAAAVVSYRLGDGKVIEPRVGIGGAESNPRRIVEAENTLLGQSPGKDAFMRAAQAAAAAVDPMEDASITASFRRELVAVVTRRALERASRSLA